MKNKTENNNILLYRWPANLAANIDFYHVPCETAATRLSLTNGAGHSYEYSVRSTVSQHWLNNVQSLKKKEKKQFVRVETKTEQTG